MAIVDLGRHILVVGTTGSGKSTVACELAGAGGLAYLELDAFNWKPGWVEADRDDFRSVLTAALARAVDGWVVDGNYLSKAEDILWPAADAVVFLDLPLPVILMRIARRTVRRVVTREALWGGNRERLWSLVSRDSLLLWAVETHRANRRIYRQRIDDPAWAHVRFVRLTSGARARRFLREQGAS